MTLTQIPICGFFVHNFQIGVKQTRDSTIELILFFFFDFHGISDFRITPDPNYYNSSLMIVPVNTFQMARSNDDSVHLHGVHLSVN